jgi:hypothetical protein
MALLVPVIANTAVPAGGIAWVLEKVGIESYAVYLGGIVIDLRVP